MSQHRDHDRDRTASVRSATTEVVSQLRTHTQQAETVAVVGAVATVLTVCLVRIALNAPVSLPSAVADTYDVVSTAALVGPALAALCFGVTSDRLPSRVGYLCLGVFALLTTLTSSLSIPAGVALVAGGALVVSSRPTRRTTRSSVVAGLFAVAVVLALGSAVGVLSVSLRSVGTTAWLVGLACTPWLTHPRRGELLLGVAVAGGVLTSGVAAPFVTGAIALVGFAVVGAPFALVALGFGGVTAALVGSVQAGQRTRAVGLGLLLFAGVPATIPRALAVVLGVTLLVDESHLVSDGHSRGDRR
ncbi:hypothetical protein SAMN04487948_11223 [Halogranum amylolyticum]|uniref:DUF8068 domain-containing protein n=1 Tax=Halogranum amylolyticum TaxID=660520 RepID=A0A1H8UQ38_9EURY|nr:hypothetical protein [Halogranum amylolyticum]SEP05261.1 hypothetical protein SAMN04487948_11223 [Halogranum amylolyticum]